MKELHLSSRTLSEQVGVSYVSISRYITGKRQPRSQTLTAIAKALHTNVDYLMGIESDEDSEQEFERVLRLIKKNGETWTKHKKITLISNLF